MHIPPSFVRHLIDGRCILFVGAGLSAAAKLPTWGALLDEVLKELESNGDAEAPELRELWKAKKYLEVADHCDHAKTSYLRNKLTELVRGTSEPIPEVHQIIRTLPWAGIVTTNYDKLIERAYAVTDTFPRIRTHADRETFGTLLFDRGMFILKAHGDIDQPQTIVLSTRSYRELIHANPAFNAVMAAILLNFSILFVGYSLNDPDFRLLIERQITDFKGTTPIRFALMSGVGKVETQILQRNAGIEVIHYPKDQHSEVLTFFRQLQATVTDEQAKKQPAAPIAPPRVIVPEAAAAAVPVMPLAAAPTPRRGPTGSPAQDDATATLRLRLDGTVLEAVFEATSASAAPIVSRVAAVDWAVLADAVGKAIEMSSREAVDAVGADLGKCFSDELLAKLVEARQLSIMTESPLETVPWEWLHVGNGLPLCLARPVFRHAHSVVTHMPLPPKMLVIGDPHGDLPGAAEEARAIARLRSADVELLEGKEATFQRLIDRLEAKRFDIVHFAGHAWIKDGQGYIYLADSSGVGARELRSFFSRNPPAIVFLNSHYTVYVPTDKKTTTNVFGFVDMAASAGIGALIGCIGSPRDESARSLGIAFHREITTGASAADALFRARVEVAGKYPDDPTPLLYVGSGVGWVRGIAPAEKKPSP